MPLILNIDTALDEGSVSLAENEKIIGFLKNENQKEHANWLHPAIKEITVQAGYSMSDLHGVAVSNGPGSYTGLRISLAAAKGLCFALQIPLITVGTLEIMALSALKQLLLQKSEKKFLLCPLIDARRMEVYYAIYDQHLVLIQQPSSLIIDPESFANLLKENDLLFFGNRSSKCRHIISNPNAFFPDLQSHTAIDLAAISFQYFMRQQFADVSYAEPYYVKEFFSPVIKHN